MIPGVRGPVEGIVTEPLYLDDPTLPGNRRIAIVLLRESPVLPPDSGP